MANPTLQTTTEIIENAQRMPLNLACLVHMMEDADIEPQVSRRYVLGFSQASISPGFASRWSLHGKGCRPAAF